MPVSEPLAQRQTEHAMQLTRPQHMTARNEKVSGLSGCRPGGRPQQLWCARVPLCSSGCPSKAQLGVEYAQVCSACQSRPDCKRTPEPPERAFPRLALAWKANGGSKTPRFGAAMASMYAHYRFYSSSEVPLDLKLHVTSLDCKHLARTAALAGLDEDIDPQDLVVRAHVYNDGTENAEQGQYTPQLPMLLGSSVFWNGWLTLPLRIQDLSRDAQLVLTLWAPGELLAGGCRITLFDERLRLRSGAHRLVLWPRIRRPATHEGGHEGMTATEAAAEFLKGLHGVRAAVGETDDLDAKVHVAAAVAAGDAAGPPVVEASLVPGVPVEMTPEAARSTLADQAAQDASGPGRATSSSSKGSSAEGTTPVSEGMAAILPGDSAWEAERLVRAKAEFDAGEIPHLPWLDRLTMRQLAVDQEAAEEEAEAVAEALEAAEEAALGRGPGPTPSGRAALAARRHPLCSFLTVEFPVLPFPVVFDSPAYADVAAPPSVQDGLVGPSALEEVRRNAAAHAHSGC